MGASVLLHAAVAVLAALLVVCAPLGGGFAQAAYTDRDTCCTLTCDEMACPSSFCEVLVTRAPCGSRGYDGSCEYPYNVTSGSCVGAVPTGYCPKCSACASPDACACPEGSCFPVVTLDGCLCDCNCDAGELCVADNGTCVSGCTVNTTCAGRCGTVVTNCGSLLDCDADPTGGCSAGQVCNVTNNGTCECPDCAATYGGAWTCNAATQQCECAAGLCNCYGRCGDGGGTSACGACDCPGTCDNTNATCNGDGRCECSADGGGGDGPVPAPCDDCVPVGCQCAGNQCGDGAGWDGCKACDCKCAPGLQCSAENICGCVGRQTCATLKQTCGSVWTGCQLEQCTVGGASPPPAGTARCPGSVCGNGIVDDGSEECDDGNTDDGDGCSPLCLLNAFEVPPVGAAAYPGPASPLQRRLAKPLPAFTLHFARLLAADGATELALRGAWAMREQRYAGPPAVVMRIWTNTLQSNNATITLAFGVAHNATLDVDATVADGAAAEVRAVLPSGVKFALDITGWPIGSPEALFLEMQLAATNDPAATAVKVRSSEPTAVSLDGAGAIATWPLVSGKIAGELGAFRYAVADDTVQPIRSLAVDAATGRLRIGLPTLHYSLRYDPDVAVLGASDDGGGRNRGDDSSASDSAFPVGGIVGVSVGGAVLLCCAFLILVAIVAAVVIWQFAGDSLRQTVLRRDVSRRSKAARVDSF